MLDPQQFNDWALEAKPRRTRWRKAPARKGRAYDFSRDRLVHIRERTRLSQTEFARLLNISVRTLRNWEQGRRRPTGPALSLIRIVDRDPPLALHALRTVLPAQAVHLHVPDGESELVD